MKENKRRTTQAALDRSILLGQFFGLMPLVRIDFNLKFKWRCICTFYTLICMLLIFVHAVYQALMFKRDLTLTNFVNVLYRCVSLMTYYCFLSLARKWPKIIDRWTNVDREMAYFYGFPHKLRFKLKKLTTTIVVLSILEHFLYMTYKVSTKRYDENVLESYWIHLYREVFAFQEYHRGLAIFINKRQATVQSALAPSILLGQCFGLMPIIGVTTNLSFSHKSFRFCYSAICIGLILFHLMFQFASAVRLFDFTIVVKITYESVSLATYWQFVTLAKKWPSINRLWLETDVKMEKHYGFPKRLRFKLGLLTTVVVSMSVLEHALSITHGVTTQKFDGPGVDAVWKQFYKEVFALLPYNRTLSLITNFTVIISTFGWNYMDLFIMLISTAVVERFVQVRQKSNCLSKRRQVESSEIWREVRVDYNRLNSLTKCLDEALGNLIIISYFINLFIILVQLLNSFISEEQSKIISLVYFLYSFGYLVGRMAAVSLIASRIYSESTAPLDVLVGVPNELYNVEVERLIDQISSDPSYFSGHNFFRIKKSILMGIAGAVVSYELIFIQFNLYSG